MKDNPDDDSLVSIDLQNPYAFESLAATEKLSTWVNAAFLGKTNTTVTLRFVDKAEGLSLNNDYCNKSYATNILSFPFEMPELPNSVTLDISPHLGDLVICVPVVKKEATEQHKHFEQHCAHLVVHGMLHLQGFDHIDEPQAIEMEALETVILEKLDYPDPYSIK